MNYGINMQTKESIIEEYLKTINFKDPKLSVNVIKNTLRSMISEEPAVQLNWNKMKSINEISNKETIVETVSSIKIIYTVNDAEGKLTTKTLTYYV